MMCEDGYEGMKSFIGLRPFTFYFQDNKKLEIFKYREDTDWIPKMTVSKEGIGFDGFSFCPGSDSGSSAILHASTYTLP